MTATMHGKAKLTLWILSLTPVTPKIQQRMLVSPVTTAIPVVNLVIATSPATMVIPVVSLAMATSLVIMAIPAIAVIPTRIRAIQVRMNPRILPRVTCLLRDR